MNKIIGGLLVIALLSRPSLLRVDYIAYEVYKSNVRILNFIIKEQVEEDQVAKNDADERKFKESAIDEVMNAIDMNNRQISALVKQKNEIVNKIETKMDLNVYAKASMSEEQITTFINFTKNYEDNSVMLANAFNEVESYDLNDVQKQLLHTDTDFEFVYEEFTNLSGKQHDLINCLEDVISEATLVLESI